MSDLLKKLFKWIHPDLSGIDDELKSQFEEQSIIGIKLLAAILFSAAAISAIILLTIPTHEKIGFSISRKFFLISIVLFISLFFPFKKKISRPLILLTMFFLVADNLVLQMILFSIKKTQLGLFISALCFLAFTFFPFRAWVAAVFGLFGITVIVISCYFLDIQINPYHNTQVFWMILQISGLSVMTVFFRSAIFNLHLKIYDSKSRINSMSEDLEDIKNILSHSEDSYREYKSSFRYDYMQEKPNINLELPVIKSIAAFLNCDGGSLIIGVDDKKNILGLEKDYQTLKKKDSDGFQLAVIQAVSEKISVEVCRNIRFSFFKTDDKEICIIRVKPFHQPAYVELKNETLFFIRTGNSTQSLDTRAAVEYIKQRWKHNN